MRKALIFFGILSLLVGISYLLILTQKFEKILWLTKEDSIVESLAATFFFLASIVSFYLYIKSKSNGTLYIFNLRRNIFFLFLSIFFFFSFGEEISWGQRIFGIESTEYIKSVNRQGEINLHNLNLFHGLDEKGIEKRGLSLWITMSRLFSLFWFSYCVIIPLINILSSTINKILTQKIKLPIVPIWISILFVINYFLSILIINISLPQLEHSIVEIKETNIAFLFFIVCCSFLFSQINRTKLNL